MRPFRQIEHVWSRTGTAEVATEPMAGVRSDLGIAAALAHEDGALLGR